MLGFDGELGALRGVDVNVGGADDDAEVREVRAASVKGNSAWNDISSL